MALIGGLLYLKIEIKYYKASWQDYLLGRKGIINRSLLGKGGYKISLTFKSFRTSSIGLFITWYVSV